MAFVTFEDFNGGKHDVNPALVQSVTTYENYDQDKEIPGDLRFTNNDGALEDRHDPEGKALVNKARTSTRVIIGFTNTTLIVKGTLAEVQKALK